MKKILLLCTALLLCLPCAYADEGMWLLKLMKQQHLEDSLHKAGLQLPPEALYSETSPSLRECIGIFGGGCTGEVVSPNGLILTNHHCGFSYVHEMSGIGHDYMKDGFFAKTQAEELRTPDDLTFTFVLRITDVTAEVEAEAKKNKADVYTAQSQGFLKPLAAKLLKKSDLKKKPGVAVRIVPFFGANRYYMFYEQTYRDIRLVANPPHNIGQFGGNSDNWIWPRQNADFAMFRIYADKAGNPAPYSPENVPLKVQKYLPVSLKGPQLGDFSMIMGFPGTTTRFLTADQVSMRCQAINEPIVLAGNPLLAYLKNLMDQSDELRLALEDEYFGLGNMVKNFDGMNQAVEKIGLVDEKIQEEKLFREFAKQSGKAEYSDVIDRISNLIRLYKDTIYEVNIAYITMEQQALLLNHEIIDRYVRAVQDKKEKDIAEVQEYIQQYACTEMPHTQQALDIDHRKMEMLIPIFLKNKKLSETPQFLAEGQDWKATLNDLYSKSVFTDSTRLAAVLTARDVATLTADPLYKYSKDYNRYLYTFHPSRNEFYRQLAPLTQIYQRGLCEMYDWAKAPDANFTLRMTYGKICDLKPRDAVRYDWRTVLDGMFEKESKTESDYFVNEQLRQLYLAKDFGRYARPDGKLQTCFLSNNDITGGNSGSPVMNAKGELIGLAFDGNIESLSSDLKFNPELQRCINVDIRYVLFIIDKFGGASYVLDELDLRP